MKPQRVAAWLAPSMMMLAALPASAADGQAIRFGQTVRGELTASDTRAEDKSLFDLYRFSGKAGQRVVLELRSTAFDPFLALYGDAAGDDPVTFDDDSGGGSDSRLAFTLPKTGVYSVRANAISEEETGAYTLKLSRAPPLVRAKPTRIVVGASKEGDLTKRDATAEDDSYYDLYRFSGAKGDRVAVELKSKDFDAYLSIHNPDQAKELGFDDDGGGDKGDARLVFVLPKAGEYDVRANAVGKGEVGHYSLTVAPAPPVPGPINIAYGEVRDGALDRGDAEAEDASFYDIYRFRGIVGDKIVVTMRSGAVDAFVSVHAKGRSEELAADDDGLREGSDARLTFTLPSSGEFDIWANTLKPGETGAYQIRLERNGNRKGSIAAAAGLRDLG